MERAKKVIKLIEDRGGERSPISILYSSFFNFVAIVIKSLINLFLKKIFNLYNEVNSVHHSANNRDNESCDQ